MLGPTGFLVMNAAITSAVVGLFVRWIRLMRRERAVVRGAARALGLQPAGHDPGDARDQAFRDARERWCGRVGGVPVELVSVPLSRGRRFGGWAWAVSATLPAEPSAEARAGFLTYHGARVQGREAWFFPGRLDLSGEAGVRAAIDVVVALTRA
jgi:hypothetical protein